MDRAYPCQSVLVIEYSHMWNVFEQWGVPSTTDFIVYSPQAALSSCLDERLPKNYMSVPKFKCEGSSIIKQ